MTKNTTYLKDNWGQIVPIAIIGATFSFFVISAFNYRSEYWFPWLITSRILLGITAVSFIGWLMLKPARWPWIDTIYITIGLAVQASHGILEKASSVEFYQYTGFFFIAAALSYKGSFRTWLKLFFPFQTACVLLPLIIKQFSLHNSLPAIIDVNSTPIASLFIGTFLARLSATKHEALLKNIQLQEQLLQEYQEKQARYEALISLASQVAHDIRSPLAALDVAVSFINELHEEKRILIRNAVSRIRDIANNLSEKGRSGGVLENKKTEGKNELSVQLLPSLIDNLITEKRTQYRSRIGVEIEAQFDQNSYGLFAKINVTEFKRVLSNLINNAVEAISEKGMVTVNLKSSETNAVVAITDTGKGIPSEILPKLMLQGSTHGKEGGSGLGLYHAKKTMQVFGGDVSITSELGKGTTTTLTLPQEPAPSWFVPKLEIQSSSIIVILDDDVSIHQIWDRRLKQIQYALHGIMIQHFSTEAELQIWCTQEKKAFCLYLLDYELIGQKKSGLDLIEKLNIIQQSILVTSRYEDHAILERCQKLGVKLIPKPMAGFVPMSIAEKKEVLHEQPDLILIDDDTDIHFAWRLSACEVEKKVKFYETAESFFAEAHIYEKHVPVYVDSNLKNGVKGELVSKTIHDQGFANLYLATGYDPSTFGDLPWIKKIVGKAPPWKNN